MSSKILEILNNNLEIKNTFPSFIELNNIHYEVKVGSVSYGITKETSDNDILAITIPKAEDIFPFISGYLFGFGTPHNYFTTFQKHHINYNQNSYDISIYSIVKYFELCMHNNPNMIDSLFVPDNCIITISKIGEMIRKERRKFLSKECYDKFKGYSYSQFSKMRNKKRESKERQSNIDKFGYDTKFAYHCVRLILELEFILKYHDLVLNSNVKFLTDIRNGEYTIKELEDWFISKETELDQLYQNCKLPNRSNYKEIKDLLLNCLEEHFGNISRFYPKGITFIYSLIGD